MRLNEIKARRNNIIVCLARVPPFFLLFFLQFNSMFYAYEGDDAGVALVE